MQSTPFKTVILGADHAGFELKEALKALLSNEGIPFEDLGCYDSQAVDYPDVGDQVAQKILATPNAAGVLCCGSGVGMSIVANRYAGLRAALCFDKQIALLSREHNNANVLCLGGRFTAVHYAQDILKTFLTTAYDSNRHQHRVEKLDNVDRVSDITGASTPCPTTTC